ncbi:AraC family transcriptional regulator [Paramixta manurensis]|uniref:AraC family transcriptional regulator n=1 Tax=Paramixta manurensis TaxID=2740817 RepID=A0A6M8UH55_9GAMM|nr:AraC family transcriptional regulator [Erwiniaceae bacterium PD-1]
MTPLQELSTLIARHAGPLRPAIVQTAIPGLVVSAQSTPSEPIHHVFEPMFVLVVQGTKKVMLGERVFRYGAGEYLVVSVELPIASHIEFATVNEPCLAVGLMLKPTMIASLLLERAGNMPRSAMVKHPGLGVSPASHEVGDAVLRLLRLLDRPDDAVVLAPAIEREILWWLLNGPQGAMVRQIGLADSRLARIGHAIRWIRANYAQLLRIEDLSALAGMSESSFHRHFRAITTMTPGQYQKQVRLQEARVRLLTHTDDVATIGFSVGYNSPSQFSREYSRFYGIPPGRDAIRLREGQSVE